VSIKSRFTILDSGEVLTYHHDHGIFSKTDTACTQHKTGMVVYLVGVHCPCLHIVRVGTVIILLCVMKAEHPPSLCGWPCTSLHLLEEGNDHLIMRFAYLCHVVGEELVIFFFLYIKLFELGVEVAFNIEQPIRSYSPQS